MSEFRIEYSIQRAKSEDDDFQEVGFGTSGSWDDIDSALHAIESNIQRREWETTGSMPDPESVEGDDE